MDTGQDTVKGQLLEERDARQRAETLLWEKEQELAQLVQQNEILQSQISDIEELKKELRYVFEVVNSVQDIIFITDSEGIFRFINPAAEKLLGFPMERMLGKHFSELILEDYAELVRSQYREEIRNRVSNSYLEFPVKNTFGKEIWLGQRVSFIYREERFFEAHSIARDITAQVEARKELAIAVELIRKSEEKYRGIMENMELGLLEVNSEARIVRAYPRFCEMVGYSEAELVGKDPKALFAPANFREQAIQEESGFLQGKSIIWEAPVLRKNGSIMWALINNTPIYDEMGNLAGTLGIHLDITAQKLLQADLERARQEAEQARDAEKAFLANMSHEIRNPINSIVGMTNLLYDTSLSQEQVEYVNTLQYSADLLHALVSDVLDISKIEQGKMEPQLEDFDFFSMAKAMCKTFEFRLSQRPVEFQCEIALDFPQYLRTDPTFLTQILLNLINNSFKFTQEGYIRCTATLKTEGEQNWMEFTINDTGIGIAPDLLPFIFERFNQAGKAKSSRDGVGLGLPITKQLIDLLGGQIQVQSELGAGTSFQVTLPFEPVQQVVTKKIEPIQTMAQPRTETLQVLIVEDNPMNRRYLENLLTKWGLGFRSADDGLIALQMLEKEHFDLILMDIRMPNLDGYETTLRLRNAYQNSNQQAPIIALTASALLDEKEKALQAGMNQHLAKPFTPEQLLEVFRQCFPDFSPASISTSVPLAINRQDLLELYEGDGQYMREIFEIFMHSIPVELAEMRQLLEAADWKNFAAKAHKIKPSFKMVGLGILSTRAEELERVKRAFDAAELMRDFEWFEKEVAQAIRLVQEELNALS